MKFVFISLKTLQFSFKKLADKPPLTPQNFIESSRGFHQLPKSQVIPSTKITKSQMIKSFNNVQNSHSIKLNFHSLMAKRFQLSFSHMK